MDIVLRAIALYVFMVLLMRIIGRRELSSMTPVDLVLLIVLGSGWLESMSINSIEPSPDKETSENGSLRLDLGPIAAGDSHLLFIYFQANPTNVGHRSAPVDLYDGDARLLRIGRSVTVFP